MTERNPRHSSFESLSWRLDVEVGNSLSKSNPSIILPTYSFRMETSSGTKVFECDFQTLERFQREIDAAIETIKAKS